MVEDRKKYLPASLWMTNAKNLFLVTLVLLFWSVCTSYHKVLNKESESSFFRFIANTIHWISYIFQREVRNRPLKQGYFWVTNRHVWIIYNHNVSPKVTQYKEHHNVSVLIKKQQTYLPISVHVSATALKTTIELYSKNVHRNKLPAKCRQIFESENQKAESAQVIQTDFSRYTLAITQFSNGIKMQTSCSICPLILILSLCRRGSPVIRHSCALTQCQILI